MLISCLLIVIGLALLVHGADRFVEGAASVAYLLGLSPLLIGLVVVGFATSVPEILVGSISAWQGKTDIAIGNALGSNIANIGLVLGISILILPIAVCPRSIKREYQIMCIAIGLAFLLMLDGYLSRADAIILLLTLIASIGAIVWLAKTNSDPLSAQNLSPNLSQNPLENAAQMESVPELNTNNSMLKSSGQLLIGLLLLLIGADLLVRGAVFVAQYFGISDLIIGLTIIAIGTSLPELATSIISLIKKKADIAIGNIIGSNLYNILAVLGIPALIHPTKFEPAVITRDFPIMIGLTLLLGGMIFIARKNTLIRAEGGLLLFCFIAYQFILFSHS